MSKQNIKKNIKLSGEFDRYVAQNPTAYKRIPRGAHVIITSARDASLSAANKSIARSISGTVVEAHKSDGGWKISPFSKN